MKDDLLFFAACAIALGAILTVSATRSPGVAAESSARAAMTETAEADIRRLPPITVIGRRSDVRHDETAQAYPIVVGNASPSDHTR